MLTAGVFSVIRSEREGVVLRTHLAAAEGNVLCSLRCMAAVFLSKFELKEQQQR